MVPSSIRPTLIKYFNTGSLGKFDIISSYISPYFPFIKNAQKLKELVGSLKTTPGSKSEKIKTELYSGKNEFVKEISEYLSLHLKNDLFGAYVHGSLATDDAIDYSDFDGIVIIRNSVFESKKRIKNVALHLSRMYSMMLKMDPLQHHGWFVVLESELNNFPISYFPSVLFEYSKSLLNQGMEFEIKYSDQSKQNIESFHRLTHSVIRKLKSGQPPVNMYALKSILSEFMLLPAVFIQAKTGKGIYKKYSFKEASVFFNQEDWIIMDEISIIRSNWKSVSTNQNTVEPFPVTPKIKKQQAANAPKIPEPLKAVLSAEFRNRMLNLATKFEESIT